MQSVPGVVVRDEGFLVGLGLCVPGQFPVLQQDWPNLEKGGERWRTQLFHHLHPPPTSKMAGPAPCISLDPKHPCDS